MGKKKTKWVKLDMAEVAAPADTAALPTVSRSRQAIEIDMYGERASEIERERDRERGRLKMARNLSGLSGTGFWARCIAAAAR